MTNKGVQLQRPAKADQNIEAIYPLTSMQEGMLYHSLSALQPSVYFQQAILRLRGPLDPASLRRAWETMLARHSILRTVFVWERLERPLQVVRRYMQRKPSLGRVDAPMVRPQ